MELYFTILSLVWVFHIFLLSEYDKEITNLLARLKFSLSINDKGIIEKIQLEVLQCLGITEVIDYKNIMDIKNARRNMVEKFIVKYNELKNGKTFIIFNLFLLTTHTVIKTFLEFPNGLFYVHLIFSFVLGFIFYVYCNKLQNVKFINFQITNSDSDKDKKTCVS